MIARPSVQAPRASRPVFCSWLILACATLIAGCARNPAPNALQTHGFELVSADPERLQAGALDYAYRIRERIDLSPNPPSGLMVGAELEVDTLWGEIKIGRDGKRMIAMIRRAEEGLFWIRLDSDMDGDLQNEIVEEWRPRARPLRFITRDIQLDEPGENGAMPQSGKVAAVDQDATLAAGGDAVPADIAKAAVANGERTNPAHLQGVDRYGATQEQLPRLAAQTVRWIANPSVIHGRISNPSYGMNVEVILEPLLRPTPDNRSIRLGCLVRRRSGRRRMPCSR